MSSPPLVSSTYSTYRRTSDRLLQEPVRPGVDAPSPSLSPSTSPESLAAFENLLASTRRLVQKAFVVLRQVEQAELASWVTEWSWVDSESGRSYGLDDLDALRKRTRGDQKDRCSRERRALDDLIHRVEFAFLVDKAEESRRLREDSARGFVAQFRQHFRDIGFL
ncbi:hypothetical protein JCM9279_005574, partial [Rhodotorula babjevae]